MRWAFPSQDPNRVEGIELYDHMTDPGENRNLAALPENAVTVRRLTEQLRLGWQHARQSKVIHEGVDWVLHALTRTIRAD